LNQRAFNRVVRGANNLTDAPANLDVQYTSSEAALPWLHNGAIAYYSPPLTFRNPMLARVRPFDAADVNVDAIEISNSTYPTPERRLIIRLHFVSNRSSSYWVDFFSTDAENVCTWWPF
jgi:hypothetical protein